MAKRFTDTEKWNDDWFISLNNDYRIIWIWLLDNCDHAGICKRSVRLLNLMCNTNISESDLLDKMEGRIIVEGNNWFIPKFIKFQYSTLLSAKPAVVGVVRELFSNDYMKLIPESFGNNYIIKEKSFENHYKMIKDKDKDKDKDITKGGKKKMNGIEISDGSVVFEDGTKQKLGEGQKAMLAESGLSPRQVIKGSIY